jgi:hypothetical protein
VSVERIGASTSSGPTTLPAPDFTLPSLSAKSVRLADLRGRSWCSTSGRPGASRAERRCRRSQEAQRAHATEGEGIGPLLRAGLGRREGLELELTP